MENVQTKIAEVVSIELHCVVTHKIIEPATANAVLRFANDDLLYNAVSSYTYLRDDRGKIVEKDGELVHTFLVTSVSRLNGTLLNIKELELFGITFDFTAVTVAHEKLYKEFQEAALTKRTQERTFYYNQNSLVLFYNGLETKPKHLSITDLDFFIKNNSDIVLFYKKEYGGKHFNSSIRMSLNKGKYEVTDPRSYKRLQGNHSSIETIIKKLDKLYIDFCEEIDNQIEANDKAEKELQYICKLLEQKVVKKDFGYFGPNNRYNNSPCYVIKLEKEGDKKELVFTVYNINDNPTFTLKGMNAKFELEGFKEIIDVFLKKSVF